MVIPSIRPLPSIPSIGRIIVEDGCKHIIHSSSDILFEFENASVHKRSVSRNFSSLGGSRRREENELDKCKDSSITANTSSSLCRTINDNGTTTHEGDNGDNEDVLSSLFLSAVRSWATEKREARRVPIPTK